MAKQSSKASKKERPSQKREKQTAENNVRSTSCLHIYAVSLCHLSNSDHAAETQMVAVTTSSPISSGLSEANTEDILNYIDNYEGDAPESLEGVGVSEIAVPFKEVTCIEKFKVIFSGLNINSEVPKPIVKKYYKLFCSQNAYLHEKLVEPLNCKLVVGLISETVNNTDAIKACKITTAESDFSAWSKTLQATEMLGMNVSFLRTRLTELASLVSETHRYKDSILEREQREAEYRAMLANSLEVMACLLTWNEKIHESETT